MKHGNVKFVQEEVFPGALVDGPWDMVQFVLPSTPGVSGN